MTPPPKFKTASGIEREVTKIKDKQYLGFQDGSLKRYFTTENVDQIERRILELREAAKILLAQFPGYLNSYDRNALNGILGTPLDELVVGYATNRISFSRNNTNWMFHRVRKLEEAGIPQIFISDFETRTTVSADPNSMGFECHKYPTLDAIINTFVKEYVIDEKRRINKAADSEDILFFRNYALGTHSATVCKEITHIIEEKYESNFKSEDSKDYVLSAVSNGFDHLQRELSVLPANPQLKEYDCKEKPADIASHPFWYTQYTPASVDLIINEYFIGLSNEFLASNELKFRDFLDSKETAVNVLYLFPNAAPNFLEQDALKKGLIKDMLQSKLTNYAFKYSGPACDSIGLSKTPNSRKLVAVLLDELHFEKVSGLSGAGLVEYVNNLPPDACIATQQKTFEALSKAVYGLIGETSGTKGPTTFAGRLRTLGFDESKKYLLSQLYNRQKPAKPSRACWYGRTGWGY